MSSKNKLISKEQFENSKTDFDEEDNNQIASPSLKSDVRSNQNNVTSDRLSMRSSFKASDLSQNKQEIDFYVNSKQQQAFRPPQLNLKHDMDISMNSLSSVSLLNITADGNINKNKNENIEGEEEEDAQASFNFQQQYNNDNNNYNNRRQTQIQSKNKVKNIEPKNFITQQRDSVKDINPSKQQIAQNFMKLKPQQINSPAAFFLNKKDDNSQQIKSSSQHSSANFGAEKEKTISGNSSSIKQLNNELNQNNKASSQVLPTQSQISGEKSNEMIDRIIRMKKESSNTSSKNTQGKKNISLDNLLSMNDAQMNKSHKSITDDQSQDYQECDLSGQNLKLDTSLGDPAQNKSLINRNETTIKKLVNGNKIGEINDQRDSTDTQKDEKLHDPQRPILKQSLNFNHKINNNQLLKNITNQEQLHDNQLKGANQGFQQPFIQINNYNQNNPLNNQQQTMFNDLSIYSNFNNIINKKMNRSNSQNLKMKEQLEINIEKTASYPEKQFLCVLKQQIFDLKIRLKEEMIIKLNMHKQIQFLKNNLQLKDNMLQNMINRLKESQNVVNNNSQLQKYKSMFDAQQKKLSESFILLQNYNNQNTSQYLLSKDLNNQSSTQQQPKVQKINQEQKDLNLIKQQNSFLNGQNQLQSEQKYDKNSDQRDKSGQINNASDVSYDNYISPDDLPDKKINIFEKSNENIDYTQIKDNSLYNLEHNNSQMRVFNKPLKSKFVSGAKINNFNRSGLDMSNINQSAIGKTFIGGSAQFNNSILSKNTQILRVNEDLIQSANYSYQDPPSQSRILRFENQQEIYDDQSAAESSIRKDEEINKILKNRFNRSILSINQPLSQHRNFDQSQIFINDKSALGLISNNIPIQNIDRQNLSGIMPANNNQDQSVFFNKGDISNLFANKQLEKSQLNYANILNDMSGYQKYLKDRQQQSHNSQLDESSELIRLKEEDSVSNLIDQSYLFKDMSKLHNLTGLLGADKHSQKDLTLLNDISNINDATGLEKLSNTDNNNIEYEQLNKSIEENKKNLLQAQLENKQFHILNVDQSLQVIAEESQADQDTTNDHQQSQLQNLTIMTKGPFDKSKLQLSPKSSQVNQLIQFFEGKSQLIMAESLNKSQNSLLGVTQIELINNQSIEQEEQFQERLIQHQQQLNQQNKIINNHITHKKKEVVINENDNSKYKKVFLVSHKKPTQEQTQKLLAQRKASKEDIIKQKEESLINIRERSRTYLFSSEKKKGAQEKIYDDEITQNNQILQTNLDDKQSISNFNLRDRSYSKINLRDRLIPDLQCIKRDNFLWKNKFENLFQEKKQWITFKKELKQKLLQVQTRNKELEIKISRLNNFMNSECEQLQAFQQMQQLNYTQDISQIPNGPNQDATQFLSKTQMGIIDQQSQLDIYKQLFLNQQININYEQENPFSAYDKSIIGNKQYIEGDIFQDNELNEISAFGLTAANENHEIQNGGYNQIRGGPITLTGLENLLGSSMHFNMDPQNLSLNQISNINYPNGNQNQNNPDDTVIIRDQSNSKLNISSFNNGKKGLEITKEQLKQNILEMQRENEITELQTSFLLSQGNNFGNHLNLTRDFMANEISDISQFGNPGLVSQNDISNFGNHIQKFHKRQISQAKQTNLDESNFNFEIGDDHDQSVILNCNTREAYNLSKRVTLDEVKQIQAQFKEKQNNTNQSAAFASLDSSLNNATGKKQDQKQLEQLQGDEESVSIVTTFPTPAKQPNQKLYQDKHIFGKQDNQISLEGIRENSDSSQSNKKQNLNAEMRGTANFNDLMLINQSESANENLNMQQDQNAKNKNSSDNNQIFGMLRGSIHQASMPQVVQYFGFQSQDQTSQNRSMNSDQQIYSQQQIQEQDNPGFGLIRSISHPIQTISTNINAYNQNSNNISRQEKTQSSVDLANVEKRITFNPGEFQNFKNQIEQPKEKKESSIISHQNNSQSSSSNANQPQKSRDNISINFNQIVSKTREPDHLIFNDYQNNNEQIQKEQNQIIDNQIYRDPHDQTQMSNISYIQRDKDASFAIMDQSNFQNSQYINASFLTSLNLTSISNINKQQHQQHNNNQESTQHKNTKTPFFTDIRARNYGESKINVAEFVPEKADANQEIQQQQTNDEEIERYTLGYKDEAKIQEELIQKDLQERQEAFEIQQLQIQQAYLQEQQLRQRILQQQLMQQRIFIQQQQQSQYIAGVNQQQMLGVYPLQSVMNPIMNEFGQLNSLLTPQESYILMQKQQQALLLQQQFQQQQQYIQQQQQMMNNQQYQVIGNNLQERKTLEVQGGQGNLDKEQIRGLFLNMVKRKPRNTLGINQDPNFQ